MLGSQSRADFQANLARILRCEADLPQGKFPLKRNALSKSCQLFQNFLISALNSGKWPSNTASYKVPQVLSGSGLQQLPNSCCRSAIEDRIEHPLFGCLDLFLKFPVESLHLELKPHIKLTQAEKTLAKVCLICPLNLSNENPTAFFTVVQIRETWRKKKFLARGSFTKGEWQIS